MNKREYLRSLGFRVGERGRFTDAMKTELSKADIVFDDDKTSKRSQTHPKPASQERVREARQLFGYTKEGYKVAFITCAYCHQHMVFCQCDKVHAPKVVTSSEDPLVSVSGV